MPVVRSVDLEGYNRTLVSRFLILLVLLLSVGFYVLFHDRGKPLDVFLLHGTGGLDSLIRALYRIAAGYLAVHAALFWMVWNPVPGSMSPLFRDELVVKPHSSTGLERLVPFSSWTLIIFGLAMWFNGLISLFFLFGAPPPILIIQAGVGVFSTAFSAAALTAVIVRYVILPSMVQNEGPIDHMFLPHEQVMHNWALILLAVELGLGWMVVQTPMVSLGLTYGALYLIFAELWAIWGGGYYVYEFIDPRPRLAPYLLLGLTLVCALSFGVGLIVSLIREQNPFLAIFLLFLLVIGSTRFKNPAALGDSTSN
ncbi:MAG: Uncharacterised protein [Methanobacteriota archaeon]|nr:MAG: Uncharacterised protein [Euryarchaeota archaeon]